MVVAMSSRAQTLTEVLNRALPTDVKRWASVAVVTGPSDQPVFTWHHDGGSASAIDFWPASVVKLYTCVAAFEKLNALSMPTHSALVFERQQEDGRWVTDAARTLPEMCSTIFRESDNDDYTLQLRFCGLDWINGTFFNQEKGFSRTALMRGYVKEPPFNYDRDRPQRVRLIDPLTGVSKAVEHTWSGKRYSKELGATVLDADTANCSPTRDMVECLRRVMFHEQLPESERYDLTAEQLVLLRDGVDGTTGLRNTFYAFAWDDGVEWVFPGAKGSYFHKPGNISNYYLELAYVHDEASGARFLFAVVSETGDDKAVRLMGRAIAEWVRDGFARESF